MTPTVNASRIASLNGLGRGRNPGQRLLAECRGQLIDGLADWLREVSPSVAEELFALADSTWERLLQTRYLDLRADIGKDWERLIETFRRMSSSEIDSRLAQAEQSAETPRAPLEIPDFEGLELIDDADLAGRIVIRELSARLSETCDNELYALDRRVAALLGNDDQRKMGENPLGPAAVCQALFDACATFGPDAESHLILLRRLERHLHAAMPEIYRRINASLIERGILPDLKRSYRRNSPAMGMESAAASGIQPPAAEGAILEALRRLAQARTIPGPTSVATNPGGGFAPTISMPSGLPAADAPAAKRLLFSSLDAYQCKTPEYAGADDFIVNHVKQFRDSDAARQAGGLEAVTMDIVAMLFDLIFDDARIPVGIKALISRLQIPVLKVAMLNPGFFGDRSHPTRRFLAGISGISIRWGGAIDESDPFYVKLSQLVYRIQREFEESAEIFGQAVDELQSFVVEREAEEHGTVQVAASLVIQHELEAESWERAQQAVRSVVKGASLPEAVADFLEECWTVVLQHAALGGEENEGEWTSAIETMKNLAWSITPKKLPDDRLKLIGLLPRLLARLNWGLDGIDTDPVRRGAFFDALVKLHAAALKGEAPAPPPEKTPSPPRGEASSVSTEAGDLLVTRSVDNGVEVEEIMLVGASPVWQGKDRDILRQVNALKRGEWVEFIDDGQVTRERLNWISPQRGILLFSNHRSAKAISITPDALARQIRDGKAAIVHEEAIFEHALNGALESVNAL
jgi:hypothetical protein